VDLVHVESVEEGGVCFLVGGCGDGRHCVGRCSLAVVLLVENAVGIEISQLYCMHRTTPLSHARELGTRVAQCVLGSVPWREVSPDE
jgi:hypothetical protein